MDITAKLDRVESDSRITTQSIANLQCRLFDLEERVNNTDWKWTMAGWLFTSLICGILTGATLAKIGVM